MRTNDTTTYDTCRQIAMYHLQGEFSTGDFVAKEIQSISRLTSSLQFYPYPFNNEANLELSYEFDKQVKSRVSTYSGETLQENSVL